MSRAGREGSAIAEYVGIVAAVALLIAGLATLRPHVVERRAPVRAIPPLARLIGEPARLLAPPPPPRAVRPPRPRRPHRPGPSRAPLVVDLPEWLTR